MCADGLWFARPGSAKHRRLTQSVADPVPVANLTAPRIILASLPSFCQKLSKLVDIWRSSGKNNFAQFFETRCRDENDLMVFRETIGHCWCNVFLPFLMTKNGWKSNNCWLLATSALSFYVSDHCFCVLFWRLQLKKKMIDRRAGKMTLKALEQYDNHVSLRFYAIFDFVVINQW